MLIYTSTYLLYAVVCFIICLFCSSVKIKRTQGLLVLAILVIINSVIAAFRPEHTPDTLAYMEVYQNSERIIKEVQISNIGDWFFNRSYYSIELGFIFIMAVDSFLFHSVRGFFFLVALAVSVLSISGILLCVNACVENKKKRIIWDSSNLLMLWCVYLFWGGILYTSVAIRSGLSIALGLCFIGLFLSGKRYFLSFCCIVLAMSIHSTAITFVVIVVLLRYMPVCINKGTACMAWGICILCYLLGVGNYTVKIALSFIAWAFRLLKINAFSSYFTNIEFAFQKREFFVIIVTGIFLLMAYTNKKIISRLSFVVLIGIMISTFAYPIHALSREVDLFTCFVIPMICYAGMVLSQRKILYIKFVIPFLLVPQYVMVFARA